MKKYILILLTGFVLLTLTPSCGKMLDEISPKGAIPTEKLTDSDIALLSNGVMHQFEAIVSNLWFEGDYLAENYTGGPGFTFTDTHAETQSASSSIALSRWTYCYGKLQYANLLLQAAEGKTTQDALEAKATAYFFRAWIYFNLVTRYGGVPLIDTPTNLDASVTRADEAAIWNFIEADLDRSASAQSEAGTFFTSFAYVSPEAIHLLRARVLLWEGQYARAITETDAVLSSDAAFQLSASSEDWAKMFINGTESRELIFAPINIRSSNYIRLYDQVNDTDGSFSYSPTERLYSSLFEDAGIKWGDIRKAATFCDDASRIIKFPNGQSGQFILNPAPSQSPLVVFRLADAYLMKAEAQWLGGSVEDALLTLKTLMQSRYSSISLPATMTDNEFENLLLDELQREFYSEGRRWFDIKRLAIRRHGYVSFNDCDSRDFTTWIKTVYPGNDSYTIDGWNDRHQLMYWPIPQAQRNQSYGALTQNPGYEQ